LSKGIKALLHETPESHADHFDLTEAVAKLKTVNKE